jgi:hypothetical protein
VGYNPLLEFFRVDMPMQNRLSGHFWYSFGRVVPGYPGFGDIRSSPSGFSLARSRSPVPQPPAECRRVFISYKVFSKSFYMSQRPHKSVNLFSVLEIVKDKLTDLWGS